MTPALVLVGSTPAAFMFAEACLSRISHLVVTLVLSSALVIRGANLFLFCLLQSPGAWFKFWRWPRVLHTGRHKSGSFHL